MSRTDVPDVPDVPKELRMSVTAPLLVAALLAFSPASVVHAAVPEQSFPAQRAAVPDTSQFLPRWLHLHAGVGYGWLSSPPNIRERYEAGQDFEFGVEARTQPRVRLRLSGEYQVLPAIGRVNYTIFGTEPRGGGTATDTLSFDWKQRGWIGAARLEGQFRLLPHTWLLAGGGRGYLGAGVRPYHFRDPFGTVDIEFPGSSGWGWLTSAGARYEFDIFGPVLGAEVRWSVFDRPQDHLQLWSIRIGWQGK